MKTRRRAPVVPPQHGAWGFLALPLLLGIAAAGWSSWLVPLAVAWVAAYPCSWALTGLLTARRPGRFRTAALVWTPVTVLAGAPVLVTHLWLFWVLLGFLGLFGVNLWQARLRRERSLANDLVLIAECVLLVPVVAGVVAGGVAPWAAMTAAPVLAAAVVTALALVGSTLHVKSLIRERANPAYTHAARVFALAALVVAVVVPALRWLVVPFALLAARAVWWHDPSWRPSRIGVVELAGLVSVAATGFLAF
ncbi:YwiC-like family protein [Amycolatopsis nalaikhensis]|uniref:YwiC-like family protein n=1 Tax=Amycolatopsis nalaikhensis TaxID=715472 RepID=A0ABY8XB55_9PSEU|nr:YwiC-like family protein [Amycolatopsis sp. 2-2]WIV53231.1 YwiC-like family protein [Amycolatopsis sp. 2-2]